MKLLVTSILGALLSLSAPAQTTLLLSIFSAQVKPDKTGEFDTMVKRLVDANRKHNGSNWIALAVEQGPGFTINFVSRHDSYAAMEKSDNAFVAAIAAVTGGPAGVPAFFREIDKTLTGSRSEVRMRRPDLSANLPSDADMMKAVGKMRYLRTSVVRMRPGYARAYEEQIKLLAAASKFPVYVSRSTLGTDGIVYYMSRYLNSLAELDDAGQTAPQILGEAGYEKYVKVLRDSGARTETLLYRVRPELSNPPPDAAAVDPAFWNPKPPAAAKAKPAADAKK